MLSDIGHRHIGGNLTHRRWKGNCAPTSDAPNMQRRVYDVVVAATECNQKSTVALDASMFMETEPTTDFFVETPTNTDRPWKMLHGNKTITNTPLITHNTAARVDASSVASDIGIGRVTS